MLVVITGGPYSGKTTLVDAFGRLGYRTVPEAAMQIIGELNADLGVEGQTRWRETHRAEFQRRVIERQLELERRVPANADPGQVVFLDRGGLDGLAYCRHHDIAPPPELLRAARAARYDRVFLLDTLARVEVRRETGRTSDRTTSLALRDRIGEVYREHGCALTFIADVGIDERVRLVSTALGLPRA